MVSDLLELQHFVELPALTKGFSIHTQGMSTGTQLACNLRQQTNAFLVGVLLSQREGFLSAFLRCFGSGAAI